MGVTKEQLQDGRILTYLIQQFIKEPKNENLMQVFRCLRNSDVWVPMNMKIGKADQERFEQSKSGEIITTEEGIQLKAKLVQGTEGVPYLPVFSRKDQIPKQFQERCSIVHLSFLDCIQLVRHLSAPSEIVLNGYTNGKSIKLDQQYLEAIEQLPSELVEEKEEHSAQ